MDDGVLKEKLEKLREPFPQEFIGKLPKPTKQQTAAVRENFKAGIRCNLCGQWHHPDVVHLDYVGHAAITARLLDVDPNWNWEPLATTESGLPLLDGGVLWIRLTVLGISRIGCGDAQGKVGPDAMKERIGDAIRNGAMRFGVALDLWHKGGELVSGESFESIEAPPEEMIKRVLDGHSKGATVGEICRKLSLSERQVKNILKEK